MKMLNVCGLYDIDHNDSDEEWPMMNMTERELNMKIAKLKYMC